MESVIMTEKASSNVEEQIKVCSSGSNKLSNEQKNIILDKYLYRPGKPDLSDSEESDISFSSDSESETEKTKAKTVQNKKQPTKKPDDPQMEELLKIHELNITVPENDVQLVGSVSSIVGVEVIVQSKDCRPLNIDSVLFLSNEKPLGKIYDVFGPVVQPLYIVRFNTVEEILKKDIEIDCQVYYAPDHEDITTFVFVEELRKQKGSDASWKNNLEPPHDCLDYSDDEQEKDARQAYKMSKCDNSDNNNGKKNEAPANGHSSRDRKNSKFSKPGQRNGTRQPDDTEMSRFHSSSMFGHDMGRGCIGSERVGRPIHQRNDSLNSRERFGSQQPRFLRQSLYDNDRNNMPSGNFNLWSSQPQMQRSGSQDKPYDSNSSPWQSPQWPSDAQNNLNSKILKPSPSWDSRQQFPHDTRYNANLAGPQVSQLPSQNDFQVMSRRESFHDLARPPSAPQRADFLGFQPTNFQSVDSRVGFSSNATIQNNLFPPVSYSGSVARNISSPPAMHPSVWSSAYNPSMPPPPCTPSPVPSVPAMNYTVPPPVSPAYVSPVNFQPTFSHSRSGSSGFQGPLQPLASPVNLQSSFAHSLSGNSGLQGLPQHMGPPVMNRSGNHPMMHGNSSSVNGPFNIWNGLASTLLPSFTSPTAASQMRSSFYPQSGAP